MTTIGIIGSDDREITNAFNTFPLSAVTIVDSDNIYQDQQLVESGIIGTGIVISPKHVLTVGHNSYSRSKNAEYSAIRVTLSSEEDDLISRSFAGNIGQIGEGFSFDGIGKDPDKNVIKRNYPANYNNGVQVNENDIAILQTNNTLLPASKVIGLTAYVDSEKAKDEEVMTAGYPGDNRLSQIPGFTNRGDGRDLIIASGIIETASSSSREIRFSPEIDAASGQSGSPVWHILENDKPRVLGILSIGLAFPVPESLGLRNGGVVITTDVYNNIMAEIEQSEGIDNADELPENAIIGSENADEIVGSYRKERILGNEGNDTLLGHGAKDRLEGGEGDDLLDGGIGEDQDNLKGDSGNDILLAGAGDDLLTGGAGDDILNGGEGDDDVAIFSKPYVVLDEETGEYSSLNYDYSQDENGVITVEDISDTPTEGKDTLRGIEWARFIIDENSSTEIPTEQPLINSSRIIPLPLEDAIANTVSEQVYVEPPVGFTSDPVTPPYVSLTAPISMLDGDIDYSLNISPYKPDTEYNISYIFDTSGSMDESELQTAKDAYIDLINYYIDTGVADKSNFSVISFSRFANPYFNLTGEQAISIIENLTTAPTSEGTKYNDALNQGLNFLSQSLLNLLNTFCRRFQLNRESFQLASS